VFAQVGQAGSQGVQILSWKRVYRPAVVLQSPHRRYDHGRRRYQAGGAALDVKEFFSAQIRAEAASVTKKPPSFRPSRVALTLLQPCAMLANGPP
jgi:hypothetical protein